MHKAVVAVAEPVPLDRQAPSVSVVPAALGFPVAFQERALITVAAVAVATAVARELVELEDLEEVGEDARVPEMPVQTEPQIPEEAAEAGVIQVTMVITAAPVS